MKAWEVLKNLQEGKKMTKKNWEKDKYIELTSDRYGSLAILSEDRTGFSLDDLLEDSDDWEVYKVL